MKNPILIMAVCATMAATAAAQEEWPEIDKNLMTATASSVDLLARPASLAVDGDTGTNWRVASTDTAKWLRIDLGARYKVGKVIYQSGHRDYRYKDYELYVTDSTSNNKADWGEPVASGTFPNDPWNGLMTQEISPTPETGQYVILHALSAQRDKAGASEISIYGIDTGIDNFELSDQTTGNTWYTDDDEVNLLFTALLPDGITAEGWLALELSEPPPDFDDPGYVWPELPPISFTITQPEGLVGLCGWMLDSEGTIHETTASIVYSTTNPDIVEVSATPDSNSIAVQWSTMVDNNGTPESFNAVGWIEYSIAGADSWKTVGPTAYSNLHSIEIRGLLDNTPYDLRIHSNGSVLTLDGENAVMTLPAEPLVNTSLKWNAGGGDDLRWSLGANWYPTNKIPYGSPPSNPTTGIITFGTEGSVVEEVTSILDPQTFDEEADTWQIGGLTVADGSDHTIDLDGNTLKVMGNIIHDSGLQTMRFAGGTLQIGEAGDARTITHRGNLILAPGATLDPAGLDTLTFSGSGIGVPTRFGLEGADVAGGELVLNTLNMGQSNTYAEFAVNNQTGLDLVHVKGNATIGGGQRCPTYFGNPIDDWRLPNNLSLMFGVLPSDENPDGSRGNLSLGKQVHNWFTHGVLEAASGGSFNAYVDKLHVGGYESTSDQNTTSYGILNLVAMDEVNIDALDMRVGYYTPLDDLRPKASGTVKLKGAEVRTDNLLLGAWQTDVSNLLEIEDTHFKVDNSLKIFKTGTMRVKVGADQPNGLDLDIDSANFEIETDGVIEIQFLQEPANGGVHWGLRWVGDYGAILGDLHASGRMQFSIPFEEHLEPEDRLYMGATFSQGGYTYAALVPVDFVLPSSVTARDIEQEVLPLPDGTITISPNDTFVAAFNPDDAPLESLWLSIDGGEEVGSITLPAPAEYPGIHTLTLVAYFEDGASASADFTVTLVPIVDESDSGNVRWAGGAALELDPRSEWYWGANWEGGKPPANPAATVTFASAGSVEDSVTSVLSPAAGVDTWQIAGLNVDSEPTPTIHKLDLNGNTLLVTGDVVYNTGVTMNYTGGTLQIGQEGAEGNLSAFGTMILEDSMTFVPHLNDINFGTGGAILGLRGVDVPGGVLELNKLNMGVDHSDMELRLDDYTGLDIIRVRGNTYIGNGQNSQAWVGNPDDDWRLPSGLSLELGVWPEDQEDPGSRGNLRLAVTHHWGAYGKLEAVEGGTFKAWLNELYLGNKIDINDYDVVYTEGILDLRAMTDVSIDVQDLRVGYYTYPDHTHFLAKGTIKLKEAEVRADDVILGSYLTDVSNLIQIDDSDFKIDGSLIVDTSGVFQIDVRDTSSGLHLAFDEQALDIVDGGVIQINFLEAPSHQNVHYGLKWDGDKKTALETLIGEGKIVPDISALLPPEPEEGGTGTEDLVANVSVVYDSIDDMTYVALEMELPDYSTYAFSFHEPAMVYAGVDTTLPVTFATVAEGTEPYGNVRFAFDAAGPEGSTVTFSTGAYTAGNSGYYPENEEGFALPLVYSDTVNWTLNFSDTGEYTITFRCFVVEDDGLGNPIEGATIAENSVVLNVEDIPLYGDANRDGVVNLLDLVFVRNRLFADVNEGDNSQADINNDGIVDLEDLIEVRNNLGAVPE